MLQSPKKTALWLLIASVVFSALLGIWAILSGTFGQLQGRVLLTTLTITAASVIGLACGAYWETGRERWLPLIGIILATFSAVMIILGIWFEPQGEFLWKVTASACFLAVATGHFCLLSLARLATRFKWALHAAFLLIYFLAGLGIFIIFAKVDGDWVYRAIGVTAILVGAVSLIIPIFHRLSVSDLKVEAKTPALFATISCPQCGSTQPNSPDPIACTSCGSVFQITLLKTAQPSPPVA